jgi:hypothetical protein
MRAVSFAQPALPQQLTAMKAQSLPRVAFGDDKPSSSPVIQPAKKTSGLTIFTLIVALLALGASTFQFLKAPDASSFKALGEKVTNITDNYVSQTDFEDLETQVGTNTSDISVLKENDAVQDERLDDYQDSIYRLWEDALAELNDPNSTLSEERKKDLVKRHQFTYDKKTGKYGQSLKSLGKTK